MTHQPGVYVPLRALFLVFNISFWHLVESDLGIRGIVIVISV